ncbi:MAG: hypothetical protein A2020_01210 [Lentisphaerae bacterium GWF2_45_14]|nr:MAG: hypothetical protein A2020_01210 [Lentisphaerae bacterium GWF2_45_14]
MPDKPKQIVVEVPESTTLSLEKAFQLFIEQSEMLEKSHIELQERLNETNLHLEDKNKELARRIEEVERIKEKLSGIIESITDAVFLLSGDNQTEAANQSASALVKKLHESGKELLKLSPLAEFLEKRQTVKDRNLEIEIDCKKFYYLLSILPVSGDGTSRLAGAKIVVIKDVTEYRKLQDHVNREDRMAALGKVAASVAHEIRNPLSAIEGFAMLLERDLKDTPNAQRLASKTVYAARQLNSVVSNLLNYTREIKPHKMPCELNMQIKDALDFISPMASDQKVEIRLELCDKPLHVLFDPVQFKQVITNIGINGVEACPRASGGWLEIRTGREDDYAVIEIIDNGEGIPDNRKKQIFDPFFTMKDGGIGIGLSLCQKIIESHNGILFECGNFGKGAHFIIKLRLAEDARL